MNLLYALGLRFFGSSVHGLAQQFGLSEKVKLTELKPVYYPIWRFDALLEGSAKADHGEENGFLRVDEGYVPGNSFAPLSYLSFSVPPLDYDLPIYDPSTDLKQIPGMDIVELPFTASPLGVMDKMREKLRSGFRLGEARYTDARWKESYASRPSFACYPIMFPLWIANIELEAITGETRSVPVVLDAHDSNINRCRMSFPPIKELFENSEKLKSNYFCNPVPFLPEASLLLSGPPSEAADVPVIPGAVLALTLHAAQEGETAGAYSRWMSPPPTSSSSIPPSPMVEIEREEGGVKWEDPRIRQWSEKGKFEDDYYEMADTASELFQSKGILEQLKAKKEADSIEGIQHTADARKSGETSPAASAAAATQMLGKAVEEKEAELEKLLPAWWKEWVSSQKK